LTTNRSIYLAPTGLGNVQPQGLAQVDWRGRGGYVVAPPSRHASGHPYQWAPGRDLDSPPTEVPAVLPLALHLIGAASKGRERGHGSA
jgi:Bifunctional DNA primase/polymerase, N-terminal